MDKTAEEQAREYGPCAEAFMAGYKAASGRVVELEAALKQAKEYLFNQSFNQRTLAAKCDEALSGAGKGE